MHSVVQVVWSPWASQTEVIETRVYKGIAVYTGAKQKTVFAGSNYLAYCIYNILFFY